MKDRDLSIDILRGFAGILMILGHAIITYPVDVSVLGWCKLLHNLIYAFHMELFFFLAGIVYFCDSYRKYIYKKIPRILVPYLLFGCISVVFKSIGGVAVNRGTPIADGLIKLIFNGGGYWFLYVMFMMYLIYPFIEKVIDSNEKKIIFVFLLIGIQLFATMPSILCLEPFIYHFPYFILGQVFAKTRLKYLVSNMSRNAMLTVEIFLAFIGVILVLFESSNIVIRYLRALVLIVFLWIFVGKLVTSKDKILRENYAIKFIDLCGKESLQLYLFNGYIMTVLRYIICFTLNITNPFIIVLGIWVPDIIITLLCCYFIKNIGKPLSTICGL